MQSGDEDREGPKSPEIETKKVDGSFFDYYQDYLSETALVDLGIPRAVLRDEVGRPDLEHTSGTCLYDPKRLSNLEIDLEVRLELAPYFGTTHRFRGTIADFDSYRTEGTHQETLVLVDLVETDRGSSVADHLWMDYDAPLRRSDPKVGDTIEFDARVELYEKGYRGRDRQMRIRKPICVDFHLVDPKNVECSRDSR